MNAQETIKANMTSGKWMSRSNSYSVDIVIDDDRSFGIVDFERGTEDYPFSERATNAAAICLAINNTFGKNIDPTKVEEMYKMLECLSYERDTITKFLSTVKLK